MELNLTGGVLFSLLCNIKKAPISRRETKAGNIDPSSEVNMMLSLREIALGRKTDVNKKSLGVTLSKYKKCQINGGSMIPLEALFNSDGKAANLNNYLLDKEATHKRIAVFIDTFIDLDNKEAIKTFVETINEIIRFDKEMDTHVRHIAFYTDVQTNEELEITFEDYLFNVIQCVISSHSDNQKGKKTLDFIEKPTFKPTETSFVIKADKYPSDLIKQYKEELEVAVYVREGWEEYLNNLKKDFETVRIYYDPDNRYPFYDVYVQTSLSNLDPFQQRFGYERETVINNPSASYFCRNAKNVIIFGTCGLGKTMLFRHLLLDSIENDVGHIPVFVSAKSYDKKFKSFIEFICSQCVRYDHQLDTNKLREAITTGKCFLILDGFDEIPKDNRKLFIEQYNEYISVDYGNVTVMSSRPVEGSIPNRFKTLYVNPFDNLKSLELIDKLSSLHNNKSLGDSFKNELSNSLFETHKSYAENPLLLTLMLRMFEVNTVIPKEKFHFYYQAYKVLSHQHDKLKEGGAVREYATGLDPDEFAEVLKRFCAYSLILEGKVFFYEIELKKYVDMVKTKSNGKYDFKLDDFIQDVTESTGIMYHDFDRYEFIHRSMQEFFCAWYLSEQEENSLYELAYCLQCFGEGVAWLAFEILDELDREKLEKYIYLPYLKEIFTEDPEHLHDNYESFLMHLYNNISYHHSEGFEKYDLRVEPSEMLYAFIMRFMRLDVVDSKLGFPVYDEFEGAEIIDYYDEDGIPTTGDEDDLPGDYDYERFGEPVVVGHNYSFKMSDVLGNPENYEEIVEIIKDRDFILFKEYENAKAYYEELKMKYKDVDCSDIKSFLK